MPNSKESDMTEQNKNLDIWIQACKPASAAIGKKKDQNGNSSINPYHMFEAATKIWGPVGVGWGYEIKEERQDDGKPIFWQDQIIWEKTHTLFGIIWYMHEGERKEVAQYGHTKQLYWSHAGGYWVSDEEAPKKSFTDMIKKCLSMTGIYADVFKGMLEDQTYKMEQHIEESLDNAENKAEKEEEYINQIRTEIDVRKTMIAECKKPLNVEQVVKVGLEKLMAFSNIPGLNNHASAAAKAINNAAGKRYEELKPTEKKNDSSKK
jgi:hypothetical protein